MEWEGVRHPFRPEKVWYSRLLRAMYYAMHVMLLRFFLMD